MSLRESQNFFYHLCSRPETIQDLKKNRAKVLRKFFRSKKDRDVFSQIPFERFQTYRDHVAIGLLGGIQTSFPVLRSLMSEKEWSALLNEFYGKRLSRSPIARQVYHEFAYFLEKQYRGALSKKFPYLGELAQYEALELKLLYAADTRPQTIDVRRLEDMTDPQTLVSLIPILNPDLTARTYRFPVHRIRKDFSSARVVKPGAFPLLVFRYADEIRFLEANFLVAKMISLMSRKLSIKAVLEKLLDPTNAKDLNRFAREAIGVIHLLNDEGVLLGFLNPSAARRGS
jgi:hypothetical protein